MGPVTPRPQILPVSCLDLIFKVSLTSVLFQVYLEAKVVYNFVTAISTLMKDSRDDDDGAEERYTIFSYLNHRAILVHYSRQRLKIRPYFSFLNAYLSVT